MHFPQTPHRSANRQRAFAISPRVTRPPLKHPINHADVKCTRAVSVAPNSWVEVTVSMCRVALSACAARW
jgi:hypothetical protein